MVATLARAKGVKLTDLAQEIGVHRNRLGDMIAGRQEFREKHILGLADALGVAPGRLFDDPLALLGAAATGGSSSAWYRRAAGQPRFALAA